MAKNNRFKQGILTQNGKIGWFSIDAILAVLTWSKLNFSKKLKDVNALKFHFQQLLFSELGSISKQNLSKMSVKMIENCQKSEKFQKL